MLGVRNEITGIGLSHASGQVWRTNSFWVSRTAGSACVIRLSAPGIRRNCYAVIYIENIGAANCTLISRDLGTISSSLDMSPGGVIMASLTSPFEIHDTTELPSNRQQNQWQQADNNKRGQMSDLGFYKWHS